MGGKKEEHLRWRCHLPSQGFPSFLPSRSRPLPSRPIIAPERARREGKEWDPWTPRRQASRLPPISPPPPPGYLKSHFLLTGRNANYFGPHSGLPGEKRAPPSSVWSGNAGGGGGKRRQKWRGKTEEKPKTHNGAAAAAMQTNKHTNSPPALLSFFLLPLSRKLSHPAKRSYLPT